MLNHFYTIDSIECHRNLKTNLHKKKWMLLTKIIQFMRNIELHLNYFCSNYRKNTLNQ